MEQVVANSVLSYKEGIDRYIAAYLEQKKTSIGTISSRALAVLEHIYDTVHLGKSLRGCLVLYTAQLYGFQNLSALIPIAAAIEMLHYGFLVQDDVMDDDMTRRGRPTVYARYINEYKHTGISEPRGLARSSANLVGDIAFFFAFELISTASLSNEIKQRISNMISQEAVLVGLGQFDDVFFSHSDTEPTLETIHSIYLNKTARYTGAVPMILGAVVAGLSASEKMHIEKVGEELGMLFQLRDDELNLVGDKKKTGKSVGSDIREGKKTYIRYFLIEQARRTDDKRLLNMLGAPRTESELDYILNIVGSSNFKSVLDALKNRHCDKARKEVELLTLSQNAKDELVALISYIAQREK